MLTLACLCRSSKNQRWIFSAVRRLHHNRPLDLHRRYSSFASQRVHDVLVPCRSNGSITLRIHDPLVRSESSSPIIIYLPPGPVLLAREPAIDVASALCTAASATVVQVNYRLSNLHRFPTCIHDVLQAYDWILQHLTPTRFGNRQGRSTPNPTPIAACGELVGGGLATMLALTECRISGPRVSALAVNEPIVDWVFPSEAELEDDTDVEITPVNHKRKRTQKRERSIPSFQAFARNGVLDAESLLSARSAYFRKPADYFDPFASAVLFFRTAGMDIPSEQVSAPLDDLAELAKYERESFYREQMMLSAIGMSSQEHLDGDKEPSRRSRKSYKTWPGVTSGLGLPETRITFGDTSPLADQAVEMAMLLRRSVVLSDRREASTEEEADRHKEETLWLAEQKAQLQATEGIRLWTAAKAQSSEIGRVAQWLRQVLD